MYVNRWQNKKLMTKFPKWNTQNRKHLNWNSYRICKILKTFHDVPRLLTFCPWTLSPTWAWSLPTLLAQLKSPPPGISWEGVPWDTSPILLKRSELSGCWKMRRYNIYNKYFITKLTTPEELDKKQHCK